MKKDFIQLIKTTRGDIPIEEIRAGDEVLGLENREYVYHRVESVAKFSDSTNHKTVSINEKIFFSPHQSLPIKRRSKSGKVETRVIHAENIEFNDVLITDRGGHIVVRSVRTIKHKDSFERISLSINKRGFFKRIWDKIIGRTVNHTYFLNGILAHNASRYWVGGGSSVNWSATGNTNWGSASNTRDNASVPTSSDDTFFDGVGFGASNSTISASTTIRSINCTGYVNALSHGASVTLSIGDGSSGSGNIALKFDSGMTYTVGSANTSQVSFISTSTTQQSVDFAGKSVGVVLFGGSSNGNWILNSDITATSNNTFLDHLRGTLNTNGYAVNAYGYRSNGGGIRTLTTGSSTFTLTAASNTAWQVSGSAYTLSAASSTIILNATTQTFSHTISSGSFGTVTMSGATATVNSTPSIATLNLTGSGTASVTAALSCTNFNRTGTAATGDVVSFSSTLSVTGNFTLAGNSTTNRLLVQSSVLGTRRTVTNTGATEIWSNFDIQDIGLSTPYDASADTGGIGDCGNNLNITFTPSTTQALTMSTNKNWNDVTIWTSRIPLPQDDITAVGWTGGTLTVNMPRMARNMDFSAASGGTLSTGAGYTGFGDYKVSSAMSISGGGNGFFRGSGSHTITMAGKSFGSQITIQARSGGSYSLNDAFSGNSNVTFAGSFTSNNFNITGSIVAISGTTAGDLGTSVITCTSTAAVTVFIGGGSATTTGINIVIGTTSTNIRTVALASNTYNKMQYILSGSTGGLDVTGSPTFVDRIYVNDASNTRTIRFTAGSTLTAASWDDIRGTAGKLMNIDSITAGTHTLVLSTGGTVSTDYVTVKNSVATGGTFYAGNNSTDSGGNTGWIFTSPPTPPAPSSSGNQNQGRLMLLGIG